MPEKKGKPAPKAKAKRKVKARRPMKARPPLKPNADGVVLLSGGNPQIPKGDGDTPVQTYIRAMPGWKRDVGRRLDALITRTLPEVKKAVKTAKRHAKKDAKKAKRDAKATKKSKKKA